MHLSRWHTKSTRTLSCSNKRNEERARESVEAKTKVRREEEEEGGAFDICIIME